MVKKYYLSAPHMSGNEIENIKRAFEDNWIAPLGPFVDEIERKVEDYTRVKNAIAMNSGTSAIHIALKQLNVSEGDTVFCSDLTFIASVNPILYCNATPVLIDSEATSWCMCPASLEKAFQKYKKNPPKAVIVVDLFGSTPDYDKILQICSTYNVPVIEDSAESLGSTYGGSPCGSFGDFGIISFNGNKIITSSGGGVLLTNHDERAKSSLHLITQARDKAPYYLHSEVGYNYRMSNICAAIGCAQMDIIDQRVMQKNNINNTYRRELADSKEISFLTPPLKTKSNHWLSAIEVNKNVDMIKLCSQLNNINIDCRHVWKPMHEQPLLTRCDFISITKDQPISSRLFQRGLCLPSWTKLTQKDLSYISARLIDALK